MCLKLVFLHFLKFASLVFLVIAQDFSLGQCLTSGGTEASKKKKKKKKKGSNWDQNEVFQDFVSYLRKGLIIFLLIGLERTYS